MKSKHTPGPWMVEFNNPFSPVEGHTVKVGKYPHRGICIVPKGGGTKGVPMQEANAKLLAAAPDLLAACKALVALETPTKPGQKCCYCNSIHCDIPRCPVALAGIAIAKAGGAA